MLIGEEQEILTKEEVDELVDENLDDCCNNDFEEFLFNNYSRVELFDMDDNKKVDYMRNIITVCMTIFLIDYVLQKNV